MLNLQAGYAVLGGYMSPVNDAYHKPGLLPAQHRIAMCNLAAAVSDLVMVDSWEASQPDAQRSLVVLQRVQRAAQAHYTSAASKEGQQPTAQGESNGEAGATGNPVQVNSEALNSNSAATIGRQQSSLQVMVSTCSALACLLVVRFSQTPLC